MIFTIKNNNFVAKVNTLGAELISCKGMDKYEYIYQTTKDWKGQAKNLFPTIGQTRDNKIVVNGKEYLAKQHGFAKDMQFEVVDHQESFISLLLKNNDESKKYFPYDFELFISFELYENKLIQTFKINNCNDIDMYFSVGSHTGFMTDETSFLDFGKNANLTEIKRENMMFLTGVCTNYFVNDGKVELTAEAYNHGADILVGFNEKSIILKSRKTKHTVKVDFSQWQYLGLWAPKNSQVGVSIMPWCGLPDSKNNSINFEEKQGNINLKKGEEFIVSQSFEFE